MNLFDLPSEPLAKRAAILNGSGAECIQESVDFIQNHYENRVLLDVAITFCEHDLSDAPSAEVQKLKRVGFFPWSEAISEMDYSLSLILYGFYKHAHDSFRRAIELVVAGAYFTSGNVTPEEANAWFHSKKDTPQFSRMLKVITKEAHFKTLVEHFDLFDELKTFYWGLSDMLHVKGTQYSNLNTNRFRGHTSGVTLLSFHPKACTKAMDQFIQTTRLLATIVAASNPQILIGLDLDMKFGDNGPISGLFYPAQSERLMRLIPDRYRPYFERIITDDESLQSVKDWFESLPDWQAE